MTQSQKQFADLRLRFDTARSVLDFDALNIAVADGDAKMSLPDFWKNQEEARRISQEVAQKKDVILRWQTFADDLEIAEELAKEATEEDVSLSETLVDLEGRLKSLEVETLFTGEYDDHGAIVSFHAGAGGTDASDWTEMLMRMILKYAEKKTWTVEILEQSLAEEAGLKSATISVRGHLAYGFLKGESGVHRLVRISPFDAEKMRHTSFAQIEVIPEIDEVESKTFEIDPKDLRIDTYMAGGHGGQSVNTTYSAVRITHIPTQTVVTCQNERSQQQNRDVAMRVLKSRLLLQLIEERKEKIEDLRGAHKSAEWGSQIRSYVIHPYKMVKDHRTDYETQEVDAVLGGDLDAFAEAYLRMKARG